MANEKYVGAGNSLDAAQKDLTTITQKHGVKNNPKQIEYTCRIKVDDAFITGQPNTDYDSALTSALQEAKLSSDELNPANLEILATGTYKVSKKKARPEPSGPCGRSSTSKGMTDLF